MVACLLMCLFSSKLAHAQEYIGAPFVKFLADGRQMQLINQFGFRDNMRRRWIVPAGWVVDGASIPWPLWSIVGGPYEGKYRDASIIHDYFCDVKRRPWEQVHNVFYEAMLASGVSRTTAKWMYLAVYRFGPRWDFKVLKPCGYGNICSGLSYYKVKYFTPAFNPVEWNEIRHELALEPDAVEKIKRKLDRAFAADALKNAHLEHADQQPIWELLRKR
jgi:hypothetical protein